ncbi:MAG: glycoside hydrolase family 25 protein [Tissierellia bacterium]|nr:glycoside hydrolase family 25 protein [Tissierellia bacterium]
MIKGIDISIWNGEINWEKVKRSGIDFVMIRSSYGDGSREFINNGYDQNFEKNYINARSVGLDIGVYHYSYAKSISEALREASFFLDTIRGKRFEYPVVLDIEDEDAQAGLRGEELTDIADSFLKYIESYGYYVAIYSSRYWLENYLNMSRLTEYDIWLAEWTQRPKYSGNYGIWQYSSTGSVDGIIGNVDLNIAYKNYPEIMKVNGLNGFGIEIKEEKSIVVYSNESDRMAAEILADNENIPIYFNKGKSLSDYSRIIHIGKKPDDINANHIIFGRNRLETVEKVLKFIKRRK